MNQVRLLFRILFFSGLLALLTIPGYAETLKGQIKGLSPQGEYFHLIRQDNQDEVQIWLSVETQFQGLSSLHELAVGDEVTVEAQKNSTNDQWESDSLTVDKVVIRNPKSDVEVMKESYGQSAIAVSLEEESKIRTQREMRKMLEQWEREIQTLQRNADQSSALQKRYHLLTQDLDRLREEAQAKLEALEKSQNEMWEQNKFAAEKTLGELTVFLDRLKREMTLGLIKVEAK